MSEKDLIAKVLSLQEQRAVLMRKAGAALKKVKALDKEHNKARNPILAECDKAHAECRRIDEQISAILGTGADEPIP